MEAQLLAWRTKCSRAVLTKEQPKIVFVTIDCVVAPTSIAERGDRGGRQDGGSPTGKIVLCCNSPAPASASARNSCLKMPTG